MFKAKLSNAKVVKGLFEAISAIINETNLVINPEIGITMAAMDTSHICLVSLTLRKEDCDEFEADENYELGINLEDLVKIIKRANSNDEITFIYQKEEKKLKILMKPPDKNKGRTFTISLIDSEEEEINVESLESMEFDNVCELDIKSLEEAIKDAEIYSEVLQINVDDKITFNASGTIGDMQYEVDNESLRIKEFNAPSSGIFAISFLKNVLKISSITDAVKLYLKSDAPLRMDFDILNASKVMYFLAPRVEEEDEMYE